MKIELLRFNIIDYYYNLKGTWNKKPIYTHLDLRFDSSRNPKYYCPRSLHKKFPEEVEITTDHILGVTHTLMTAFVPKSFRNIT
jgi:hypothetical protein